MLRKEGNFVRKFFNSVHSPISNYIKNHNVPNCVLLFHFTLKINILKFFLDNIFCHEVMTRLDRLALIRYGVRAFL